MPRINIWVKKEEEATVKDASKAHGIAIGSLLVKLIKEDNQRKAKAQG